MKQQLSFAGSAGGSSRRSSFRHKPDGKLDPAGEVGWYLQYERERRGETLADAAAETRIKATYLHALEQGALDQLPGWPYSLGFVRGYAKFLGLEPEPLVEHYATFIGKPAVIDRVGSRSAWWRHSASTRSAAAMIGIVSISVIGFWAMFQDGPLLTAQSDLQGRTTVAAIDQPADTDPLDVADPLGAGDPLRTASPVPNDDPLATTERRVAQNIQVMAEAVRETPVETASASAVATGLDDTAPEVTGSLAPVPRVKPSRSVAMADRMAALDAALPTVRVKQKSMGSSAVANKSGDGVGQSDVETALAIDGTAPDSTEVPSELTRLIASALSEGIDEEVSRQLSATTTISPAGANPNGGIVIAPGLVRLRARDNVWMRVEDRGGEVLISQTLARGEVYEVPEREGLVLIVRDAGALEYAIGENPFTTLGQPGQILVSHPLAASKIGKLDG